MKHATRRDVYNNSKLVSTLVIFLLSLQPAKAPLYKRANSNWNMNHLLLYKIQLIKHSSRQAGKRVKLWLQRGKLPASTRNYESRDHHSCSCEIRTQNVIIKKLLFLRNIKITLELCIAHWSILLYNGYFGDISCYKTAINQTNWH